MRFQSLPFPFSPPSPLCWWAEWWPGVRTLLSSLPWLLSASRSLILQASCNDNKRNVQGRISTRNTSTANCLTLSEKRYYVYFVGSPCGSLHVAYVTVIVVLVIIIVLLSVMLWRLRRRLSDKCRRCGNLIAMVGNLSSKGRLSQHQVNK